MTIDRAKILLYNSIVLLAELSDQMIFNGNQLLEELGMSNAEFYDIMGMDANEFMKQHRTEE